VNVRDDRDAHRRRATLAQRAGILALALAWVASGFFLWRTEVPRLDLPDLDPRAYFGADALARSAEFRRVTRVLLVVALAVELAVIAVAVWKAGTLADALSGLARGRIRTGILVALAVVLAVWLATLPIDAVSHWWRRRFGLSEQAYTGWFRDELVSLGLRGVLIAAAVAGAMALATWLGASWWLAGAPALAAVGVLFVLAQPLVIQPLFNRFEPVRDPELAAQIQGLARDVGVRVETVQVADASRRTTAANAYVAGIGPTKRVVLYDTLLDGRFSRGEILSVSAHELAHVGRSHLWKGLAWFALIAVPGVFLVAWITERRGGLADPSLVPLGLAVALVFFLLSLPFQNLVSRRYEAEADWLALRATEDPASAIDLDRRLVVTSLGDPDPPAWITFWFGTHPPAIDRIAMAEVFISQSRSRPGARAGS
jgi:STE24 endopeptidase